MSIYPTLCSHIALPDSSIKSPGILLKEIDQIESTQEQIRRLLKYFNSKASDSSTNTSLSIEDVKRLRANSEALPENSYANLWGFLPLGKADRFRSRSETCSNGPSPVKNVGKDIFNFRNGSEVLKAEDLDSEKPKNIQRLAMKILSLYGISVVLEVNSDLYEVVDNALKCLIPAICFLPEEFIKKLQIKQLVLCEEEEDRAALQYKYPSKMTVLMPLNALQTQEKASKKLHKIILDILLSLKTDLIEDWAENHQEKEGVEATSETEFVEVYIALMRHTSTALMKPKIEKMKRLLIRSLPDYFSEEWFVRQIKEKKKSCKVQFSVPLY